MQSGGVARAAPYQTRYAAAVWRPAERNKHELPGGDWPSRAQAAAARWFQPISLGSVTLRHRTWIPAMVPWRATEQGMVTPAVLDWYGRFAQGKPGAVVVEATGVRDVPSGPLLRIGHDRFLPGLRQLVETVRERSEGHTRLFIQLIDFLRIRRRPQPEQFFGRFLEIRDHHHDRLGLQDEAAVRARLLTLSAAELETVLEPRELESLRQGFRERVTDLDQPHIRELPQVLPGLFADAAQRAQTAGFDGVELHYAHAYTMASLLSRRNTRDDGYGGPREHRVRLPLEVFAAVRDRVGAQYCVGCRFLADEIIDGGSDLEDACYFGLRFGQAGMDFLSLSRGGKFEDAMQPKVGGVAYPYTGRSGYECMPTVFSDAKGPFGRNIAAAAAVRMALRERGLDTPVVAAGGICSFSQAEAVLERGYGDIVGAARQSMADPDWFAKILAGEGERVRRCKFTNYCEALDQKHKVVTCQLWDRKGLEGPDVPLTLDGRRRMTAP